MEETRELQNSRPTITPAQAGIQTNDVISGTKIVFTLKTKCFFYESVA